MVVKEYKELLKKAHRIVVKVGTSTLTYSSGLLNLKQLEKLIRQLADLHNSGREVFLVTSGAVGAGSGILGLRGRPRSIPERQAAAAVGQGLLMQVYSKIFAEYGVTTAQILLTRDDMSDRHRYLNARNTLLMLVSEYKTVPIINENDTVATEELHQRFGDNDTLSALVAGLIGADLLILLSDIPGLYTSDPKTNQDARLIPVVEEISPEIISFAGEAGSDFGTGGMTTKLEAAKIVTRSGIIMTLASGEDPEIINKVISGQEVGTVFLPCKETLLERKRWIAFAGQPRGTIRIDSGAVDALLYGKKSLLPSGVIEVKGDFNPGDLVSLIDENGSEVARGLSNFPAEEVEKIMGHKTASLLKILGHKSYDEVIHRNNLVCVKPPSESGMGICANSGRESEPKFNEI